MAYKYKRKTKDKIWMRVSKDKYELPEIVADSAESLARKCGTTAATIRTEIHRKKHNERKTSRYVSVDILEDDE